MVCVDSLFLGFRQVFGAEHAHKTPRVKGRGRGEGVGIGKMVGEKKGGGGIDESNNQIFSC